MHHGNRRTALFIFVAASYLAPQVLVSGQFNYTAITGYLCVNSEFTRTLSNIYNDIHCAVQCTSELLCQAFTMADGPCQMFVFDKCSKTVKNCNCSKTGQVFVKQQSGLQPGALCPPGYGDDLCGVKYKIYTASTKSWFISRQKCESDSGLVIMADVTDTAEMTHIGEMCNKTGDLYLGGFQPSGSPEPGGGWYWVGCNTTVNGPWSYNEPNNNGVYQNFMAMWKGYPNLGDANPDITYFGLCECVSPFD